MRGKKVFSTTSHFPLFMLIGDPKEKNKSSAITEVPRIPFTQMKIKDFQNFRRLRGSGRDDKVINFVITLMDLLCECIDPARWHIN